MLDLVQNTVDGIAAGAAYALLAIGFTLIFGVMRRLNIAFGPSIMVGVFLGAWVHAQWSAGLVGAAVATFIGALIASGCNWNRASRWPFPVARRPFRVCLPCPTSRRPGCSCAATTS